MRLAGKPGRPHGQSEAVADAGREAWGWLVMVIRTVTHSKRINFPAALNSALFWARKCEKPHFLVEIKIS
jgi:hypothetical protein